MGKARISAGEGMEHTEVSDAGASKKKLAQHPGQGAAVDAVTPVENIPGSYYART